MHDVLVALWDLFVATGGPFTIALAFYAAQASERK